MTAFAATEVLGAMITPALLISAAASLVISTSNRVSRVVDRVRSLAAESERDPGATDTRRALVSDQLDRLSDRALLLRSALTWLYTAIGTLLATSITIGIAAVFGRHLVWLPVTLALAGVLMLFTAAVQLVREARLAVGSTLRELEFVRRGRGV